MVRVVGVVRVVEVVEGSRVVEVPGVVGDSGEQNVRHGVVSGWSWYLQMT